MSDLALFMKKNKKIRNNTFYPATKSLVDPKTGKPLEWEIKPLTTTENEQIRMECTHEVPIPGKRGQFKDKINTNEYLDKLMVAAIVYPDLDDAELQDSYGVKTPEDLLKELVDDPSEYADLMSYIQEQSGFDKDMNDEIEEAKN